MSADPRAGGFPDPHAPAPVTVPAGTRLRDRGNSNVPVPSLSSLAADLARAPVRTRSDAEWFVRFALRAVKETPIGDRLSPARLLGGRPVFRYALAAVEDVLAGAGPAEDWDELWDATLRAADLVGPYEPDAVGVTAAAWAVFHLVLAVDSYLARPATPEALDDAAAHAAVSADLAARAGEGGPDPEAVAYLWELARKMFGIRPPSG